MVDRSTAINWSRLSSLRLRSRAVADGVYAGSHRSARRGAGVEFGGHRDYVAGDDLRWLDHRAMMRHGKLLVRLFETETDRAVALVVDASASMAFKGESSTASKFEYASLLAAALARVAVAAGDPVSLDFIGGKDTLALPQLGGKEAFERVLAALTHCQLGDTEGVRLAEVEHALAPVHRRTRRGSIIVFVSDLIDLPEGTLEALTALSTNGRTVIALQVLDPLEAEFPFDGPVRFRPLEGTELVEADATASRAAYLEALARLRRQWAEGLLARRGTLIEATTTEDPVEVLRSVLVAAGGGPR